MNKKQLFIAVLVSVVSCGLQAMTPDDGYVKPQEQTTQQQRVTQQQQQQRVTQQQQQQQQQQARGRGSKAFFF